MFCPSYGNFQRIFLIKMQTSIGSPIPSVIITAVAVTLESRLSRFVFISSARESPSVMACLGISMFENDRFPGFSYKYKIIVFFCCCCCCLMTFSKFEEHSSPLFKTLNIIKLHDLVSYQIAIFMYKFKNRLLPLVFNNFFTEVSKVHQYNTRSAAKHSYCLPKVRTNYGKFNIRFQAPMIWNAINEQVKTGSLSKFKLSLKEQYLSLY